MSWTGIYDDATVSPSEVKMTEISLVSAQIIQDVPITSVSYTI